MRDLFEIAIRRTPPGVIIFDPNDRLLFVNGEAATIIPSLAGPERGVAAGSFIPGKIRRICQVLRANSEKAPAPTLMIFTAPNGTIYTLRALLIDEPARTASANHVMVLLERIVERHEADFAKAQLDYNLSVREIELLKLLCRGLPNKEISEMMFICEYTVKDHIKRIMRKMGVGSRGEIVARLK